MAVIATIQSIGVGPDSTGTGINNICVVAFSDSVTAYYLVKTYAFPSINTIAANRTIIQTDLNAIKILVAGAANLQQYIGTVLT